MGLTLIGSLDYGTTPSSSDDFNITGVDEIVFEYSGISHPGSWGFRLSDDGGTTFYSTSGDYFRTAFKDSTGETDTADTLMRLAAGNFTGGAGMGEIAALQGAHPAQCWNLGNTIVAARGIAHNRTKNTIVGPFNHLRLISLSGNCTAGKIFLYSRT